MRRLLDQSMLVFLLVLAGLTSCNKEQTPKPRGYFRISFPPKVYTSLNRSLPFDFQIPIYSNVTPDLLNPDQKNWITVQVPGNHAQIHISYKKIDHNLAQLIEESRGLALKHTQKASSIDEQLFVNPSRRTFGTIYTLKGNVASSMQFYLTDSVSHFLRGALYISEVPNYDSLRPVIQFLSQDVVRMIATTEWKETDGH